MRRTARHSMRPIVVAESLAALCGPDGGIVELPQRLCRSGGQRVFDLGNLDQALDMYESMLATARTQADLAEYASGELLARLWPEPFLDRDIRRAWESVHPLLAHPLLALAATVPDAAAAVTGPASS